MTKPKISTADVLASLRYIIRVSLHYLSAPESCDKGHIRFLEIINSKASERVKKRFKEYSRAQSIFDAQRLANIYSGVSEGRLSVDQRRLAIEALLGGSLIQREPHLREALDLTKKEIAERGGPAQAANDRYGAIADFSTRYGFKLKKRLGDQGSKTDEFSHDDLWIAKALLAISLTDVGLINEKCMAAAAVALDTDFENLQKIIPKLPAAAAGLPMWYVVDEVIKSKKLRRKAKVGKPRPSTR